MLIEIFLFIFLGILAGTVTGLTPGIHINLVGTILVGLAATAFSGVDSLFLVLFIASMAISHTFVDFIPSIFLGCPSDDTQLSVLPGHELLKEGKGYEAVSPTAYGRIYSVFILLIISFPLAFLISKIYEGIHSVMFWILLATSFILIFAEKKKFTAIFVFAVSGILGLCVLNSGIKESLLPLLSGLFGSSLLIMSIKNKIEIPKQEIISSKPRMLRPIIGSIIASPLCGFLPGLGSGQAALLGNTIARTDKKAFLSLVGATNILVMGLSFVSLYAISKTRTGAAAAIQELMGNLSWKILLIILFAVLLSGLASFFFLKFLAKFLAK